MQILVKILLKCLIIGNDSFDMSNRSVRIRQKLNKIRLTCQYRLVWVQCFLANLKIKQKYFG